MTKTENKLLMIYIVSLIGLLSTSWGLTYYWLILWAIVGIWVWLRSDEE